MEDSLSRYSIPLRQEDTKLATVYWLNPRDSKKGRLFMPVYDARHSLEFRVEYVYVSRFLERGNAAGNHYHLIKQEILIPLQGTFEVYLEDVKTKEREMIPMPSEENKAVYIRTGVSHKVVSVEDTGILLVLASTPSTLQDEIEYPIK